MRVVFRTDASLEIGTGHVMRCLTLANALRERGAECQFVCREHLGNLNSLIRRNGFKVFALPLQDASTKTLDEDGGDLPAHSAWVGGNWKYDADATSVALGNAKVDWAIVDHYGLDARWESELRRYCGKVLVIDDLADRQHDCDLFLDQNIVAGGADRHEDKLPSSCGKMLGPDYALLQPQYAQLRARTEPRVGKVKRILVYFGGADTENLTGLAVSALLSLDRSHIAMDVVVNSNGRHVDAISEQVGGHRHIALHTDLPSLAPLMAEADLAIGGSGATSWERCCLGLPALVVTLAENQREMAAELDRHGLVRWLGHYDEVSADRMAKELRDVLDSGLEPCWSERCRRLVDGNGAKRVSGYLTIQSDTALVARLAGLEDESLFLEWANDPLTRESSFNSSRIDSDTHRAWFRPRISDPDSCRMYVVETDEALPIGQVRFTRAADEWEIHYGLDARCRGRGIGRPLLATALEAVRTDSKASKLAIFGRVKPENMPSRKIFAQLGFSEESVGEEFVYRQESG